MKVSYIQEAYKGEIQCPVLPNQICFLTNQNKFHVADLQLLLLSSNQKQWFTGNGTSKCRIHTEPFLKNCRLASINTFYLWLPILVLVSTVPLYFYTCDTRYLHHVKVI